MAGATITNAFAPPRRMRNHARLLQGGGDMTSRRGWLLALSLVCRIAAAADPPARPPPVVVIRAGTLIDGVSGQAKSNQTIVIRGNRIESVGTGALPAGAKVIDLSGAKVIDLSGATVLPGMIDAHT